MIFFAGTDDDKYSKKIRSDYGERSIPVQDTIHAHLRNISSNDLIFLISFAVLFVEKFDAKPFASRYVVEANVQPPHAGKSTSLKCALNNIVRFYHDALNDPNDLAMNCNH